MTRYTEGFGYFVTSMTAPVASGWSDGRVRLAPTGKAPPYHGVTLLSEKTENGPRRYRIEAAGE